MYETLFALSVIIQLLVPGYIYRKWRSRFLVIDADKHHEDTLIGYVMTGLVVACVTWPIVQLLGFDPLGSLLLAKDVDAFRHELGNNMLRWIFQLLVAPVFLAMVVAYFERKAWDYDLLTRIGLPPVPRYPNALSQACHVHHGKDPIVKIEIKGSGELVFGRLGPQAVVTAQEGYPDIFLDTVYLYDAETGDLVEEEGATGQVILGNQVAKITFYQNPLTQPDDDEGSTNDVQQEG